MSFEDTTVELLNLPACKKLVSTYAGMSSLDAFKSAPEKLRNLLDDMARLPNVPVVLNGFTMSQIDHAIEMVRIFVLKDISDMLDVILSDDDEVWLYDD